MFGVLTLFHFADCPERFTAEETKIQVTVNTSASSLLLCIMLNGLSSVHLIEREMFLYSCVRWR